MYLLSPSRCGAALILSYLHFAHSSRFSAWLGQGQACYKRCFKCCSAFNRNNPPRYHLDPTQDWQEENLTAPGLGHSHSEFLEGNLQGRREEITSQQWDKVYKRRETLDLPHCSTYPAVKKSSLFFSLLVIKLLASRSKSWAWEGSACVL